MRIATATLAAVAALMAAGSALAAAQVTDVDYIKASRCRGIAISAAADTADLDAWLKAASKSRSMSVMDKAAVAEDAGRREAKTTNAERKARLATELSGPCQAFKG
ncbi:MAG: hypothetical protein Q7T23_15800 [Phenylobacterium sp.]|uniref:Secreted protein n=1 Tax=Phenylobacterium ferrooxidans TaxID=2982689 RepID=A0ABW6CIL3_9CAUL|nr:hypothetical protein [Phenylobacterium sp.]